MISLIGAAGLWGIQHLAHSKDDSRGTIKTARSLATVSCNPRASSGSDRPSTSVDSGRNSTQQQTRSYTAVRDGAFVCFKDRTGQVAVIQPYGSGGSWQLAVTCASGGCSLLPEGAGTLSHISSDAVFLVRQVGTNFAFFSPGAEGRYLSAARDLAVPPVLDSTKLTTAAQWRVSGQGIINVHHPHRKLPYTVCEVKLVPQESISAVERSIADFTEAELNKVAHAQAASRALQGQLRESAKHLTQTTVEYDQQVQQLKGQLGEACMFNTQLTALIEQKDGKLQLLKDHLGQVKAKQQAAERELSTAYTEVATLQQQLAERDEDVHNLQQRMCSETKQWNQLRAALQDSLQAKDEEITALSLQVQRMEHALRTVENTLCGMRKPRHLDRASLDALSIHQLQAAVDSFAAAGDGLMLAASQEFMSTEEAEALRVLLQQQSAGLELEPGTELSLQDLDRTDQGSPGKHVPAAAAAVKVTKLPVRGGVGAAAGSDAAGDGTPARKGSWAAGHSCSGRGLLSAWGLPDSTSVSSSRGARSSATSEGRHRYAGDVSDADSLDGDGAGQQHAEGDAAGCDEGELDAVMTSMDEEELQQQLGRLKASASQLSSSCNSRQQLQQQAPLHTLKPTGAVAAALGKPYASLTQLSPVKEEQPLPKKGRSSVGASAVAGKH